MTNEQRYLVYDTVVNKWLKLRLHLHNPAYYTTIVRLFGDYLRADGCKTADLPGTWCDCRRLLLHTASNHLPGS